MGAPGPRRAPRGWTADDRSRRAHLRSIRAQIELIECEQDELVRRVEFALQAGVPPHDIARPFGKSVSTLYRWLKRHAATRNEPAS